MNRYETAICDKEPYDVHLYFNTIVTVLVIAVILLLLTHSLYTEWSKRHDLNFQVIPIQSRVGYIMLQCLALCGIISDFIRLIIDPLQSFLPNTIGCFLITYSPKTIPGLSYSIYLYLILLRLQNLDGTYLNTSQCTIRVLRGFICSVMGFQVAFLFADQDSVCLHPIHPTNMERELWYCELTVSKHRLWLALSGITMIALLNIVMGILFARKMQQVVQVNAQFRDIVTRNTILTATGSISTLLCYCLWAVSPPTTNIWLYLDALINCCVIGLAFPHNRKWYKMMCGCCIKCCWRKLDAPGLSIPRIPIFNRMASIGEDIVLDLNPKEVPQHMSSVPVPVGLSPPKSSRNRPMLTPNPMVLKNQWGLHKENERPSGSLSASDPDAEQSVSGSTGSPRGSLLSSLSETQNVEGAITEKESVTNTARPTNERRGARSVDTIPTIAEIRDMIKFLSRKRRASI